MKEEEVFLQSCCSVFGSAVSSPSDWTLYTKGNSERDQLQTSYNNLTEERDQLQTSYNDLKIELQRFEDIAKEKTGLWGMFKDADKIQTLEPKRTGLALSDVKKSSCRAAAVCLGLLCLLLLTGLITLVFLYTKGNSERDQLQTSYNNLTEERNQLQTSYINLNKEQDQLQKRFDDMAKERNYLQRKLQELGWVYFSGSFYYISSLAKSWQQSRDDCQQRGADLVIINSKEEQDFIRSFRKRMWIGLTDREREGTWKWGDGTPLTTSFWVSGEPNGQPYREEDCAEILSSNSLNSWNDVSCDDQRSWICEKTPF
ncbi:CD209 antigen-like protein E [Larimichthys crocea]|uniref:CD209 antigen-like protein E n=1 Tax=Larimichthys crocea TaxID=215358 RepID=UPI000F5F91DE|nr:CD209 antigen-like protein E [Larimichthys crocea]